MCLGDAFDDRQAEADTCVVGAYACGVALKRLDERGGRLWGELLAGVLDGERDVVQCGSERDTVLADRRDVVARDCERVSRR